MFSEFLVVPKSKIVSLTVIVGHLPTVLIHAPGGWRKTSIDPVFWNIINHFLWKLPLPHKGVSNGTFKITHEECLESCASVPSPRICEALARYSRWSFVVNKITLLPSSNTLSGISSRDVPSDKLETRAGQFSAPSLLPESVLFSSDDIQHYTSSHQSAGDDII